MDALARSITAPLHDKFGIPIVRPWVSPSLLQMVKPLDYQSFRIDIFRGVARNLGIPWEFLRHLESVF